MKSATCFRMSDVERGFAPADWKVCSPNPTKTSALGGLGRLSCGMIFPLVVLAGRGQEQ